MDLHRLTSQLRTSFTKLNQHAEGMLGSVVKSTSKKKILSWSGGSLVLLQGKSEAGKTSWLLQRAAQGVQAGFSVVYLDVDRAVTHQRAYENHVQENEWTYFSPKSPEEAIFAALEFIATGYVDLLIVDSVSGLTRGEAGLTWIRPFVQQVVDSQTLVLLAQNTDYSSDFGLTKTLENYCSEIIVLQQQRPAPNLAANP